MKNAQKRSIKPRARGGSIGTLGVGILTGIFLFIHAGTFLVVEDPFTHADAALVLSGGPVPRALAARDLYLQGRVDRILIIPEPSNPFEAELLKLGLWDPSEPPWSERILIASGVPKEKVVFLPGPAEGTLQEAVLVKKSLKGKFPAQMVLVTSKSATRRARFLFRYALRNEPVKILSHPTPYDPFFAYRWWMHPRNALHVVTEYQKFLVNALTLVLGGQGA